MGSRLRRDPGQLVATTAAHLQLQGSRTLGQGLGLSHAAMSLLTQVTFDLANRNLLRREYRLSELARIGGVSVDTVRRTMRVLIASGWAEIGIQGTKGRGLESTWFISQPVASTYRTATQLCAEGRLPGFQKTAHGKARSQRAKEAIAAVRGLRPRPKNTQEAARMGKILSSPSENQNHSKNTPHPILPPAPDEMTAEEGKGKESLPEALVGLGFDGQGAQMVAAQAPHAKCSELADLLRRLCAQDLPVLATRLSHGEPVKNPYGLVGWAIHRTPARVSRAAKALLLQHERDAQALVTMTAQLRMDSVPLSLQAPLAAWQRAKALLPLPDSAGYLEAFDLERATFAAVVQAAETVLTAEVRAELVATTRTRLLAGGIEEGSLVWSRAWAHHHGRAILAAAGLPQLDEA